ncbi:MAG TPA: DUF1800 domain-containing protein [Gemmataceae bacterium]|nr:DUF1800 domain-containing protein [Gemmataceae bacterium]
MTEAIDPRWAWEPYQPSEQSPWDLKRVGHLYRRASFGATWSELEQGLQAGPGPTIDRLLKGDPPRGDFEEQTAEMARSITRANNGQLARAWWLYRMLLSPHPLREKLTLFWHNHFATSNAKVNNAGFMLGQYELMNRHALGKFGTLLQEMSQDPAMMVWLDTSLSKKGMPNENYARELMELFSLGIGHYTEHDVREAARAFTGWEIQQGKAVFNSAQHDEGDKTVLKQNGNWTGADIVRICLEQPATPYFIAGKLYRFLISETVPATPELLEPLATQFRKSDFDFGALVETMLRSNLFFSPATYRTRVKPPVDFALGIVRALEARASTTTLANALQALGQDLFYPPSVKGWDGGAAWLNGQTLLFRQNWALTLCSSEDKDPRDGVRRPAAFLLAQKYGKKTDAELVDFFLRLLLQDDVPSESRARLLDYQEHAHKLAIPVYWTEHDAAEHRVRTLCHLVLTLPEYQLE